LSLPQIKARFDREVFSKERVPTVDLSQLKVSIVVEVDA